MEGETWVLTPEEIEGRRFTAGPEGYDRAEVDAFLVEVAAAVRAARARLAASAGDTGDAFAVLGQEVADILRATELAAARKRDELEAELGARRAELDIALEETRHQAEREHEQAKRLLVRAQQRADEIVAEAEERARARVRRADAEARERSEIVLERARRREARLLDAERAAAHRIQALRAQLAAVLDGVAGDDPEPVLDLTAGEAVLVAGDQDDRSGTDRGIVGVIADPVDHLVRAAVARAQDHAIRADTPAADDDGTAADEPGAPLRPDVDSGGHPANRTPRG